MPQTTPTPRRLIARITGQRRLALALTARAAEYRLTFLRMELPELIRVALKTGLLTRAEVLDLLTA